MPITSTRRGPISILWREDSLTMRLSRKRSARLQLGGSKFVEGISHDEKSLFEINVPEFTAVS